MTRRTDPTGPGRWRVTAAIALVVGGLAVDAGGGRDARAAAPTGRVTLAATPVVEVLGGVTAHRMGSFDSQEFGTPLTRLTVRRTPGGPGLLDPCTMGRGQLPGHEMVIDVAAVGPTVLLASSGWPETCLRLPTPADVTVEQLGTVALRPFVGGLQYVPAPTPEPVAATAVRAPGGTVLDLGRPAGVADGDAAAVLLVELRRPTGSARATTAGCGHPVPATDDLATTTSTRTVDIVELAAGEAICAWTTGEVGLDVTLLGVLSTSGPDASRLPPSLLGRLPELAPAGLVVRPAQRVVDTRSAHGPVAADQELRVDLAAVAATFTTAAVLNVTATAAAADGYVTAYPCGSAPPEASILGIRAGHDVAGRALVRLGPGDEVCLRPSVATHLVVDLQGLVQQGDSTGAAFAIGRVLDTRSASGGPGALEPGRRYELVVAGRGEVPAGAVAVSVNLTATGSAGDGYVTAYPCDAPRPPTSNVNTEAGADVAGTALVGLSADGRLCVASSVVTDLVVDLEAWFGGPAVAGAGWIDLFPTRVLDTRSGRGTVNPFQAGADPTLRPAKVRAETVVGPDWFLPGLHRVAATTGVVVSLTATEAEGTGYVTVWPCTSPRPATSSLNVRPGVDVTNLVTVMSDTRTTAWTQHPDDALCIVSTVDVHLVVDSAARG